MTGMREALLAAVLAGAVAVAAPAMAQPVEGGWHGGGGNTRVLRSLGLDDAQKASVKQLTQASRAQTRPVWQQLRAVHTQLNAALFAPGTTEATLLPLVQQEAQLRQELESAHYALLLQIRDVLTPAQVGQAATIQQQLAQLHAAERQITSGQSGQ